jgi:hypothetical protein
LTFAILNITVLSMASLGSRFVLCDLISVCISLVRLYFVELCTQELVRALMQTRGIDYLASSASNRGLKSGNSRSSKALKTSWGVIVFLFEAEACSFELEISLETVPSDSPFQSTKFSLEK